MGQASIAWLLSHESVATVTPTFRTTDDIDEWAAASDVPKLSEAEMDRVAELYENDFEIGRDDGDGLAALVGRRRRHRIGRAGQNSRPTDRADRRFEQHRRPTGSLILILIGGP